MAIHVLDLSTLFTTNDTARAVNSGGFQANPISLPNDSIRRLPTLQYPKAGKLHYTFELTTWAKISTVQNIKVNLSKK